jgi:hypothetical protein
MGRVAEYHFPQSFLSMVNEIAHHKPGRKAAFNYNVRTGKIPPEVNFYIRNI